jgi:hypothetical protein
LFSEEEEKSQVMNQHMMTDGQPSKTLEEATSHPSVWRLTIATLISEFGFKAFSALNTTFFMS